PPVLFEVLCFNNSVHIGGYPWHFIYTPPQKNHKGTYHVCSLKDSTLAINGVQNMNCDSLESDAMSFHPDDSGRIIHVGPNTINVLKLVGDPSSNVQSRLVKDFSMVTHRDSRPSQPVTVTSSGRTVRRRFHQLDDDPDQEVLFLRRFQKSSQASHSGS
ncbi:unnamed protein product, partial [Tetraodon nigroviridis]